MSFIAVIVTLLFCILLQPSLLSVNPHSKEFQRLLTYYNKYERPKQDVDPHHVFINLLIRSVGQFDVLKSQYKADFYLRQQWIDPRLDLS